ncbi:uncharacterized protein [Rutidosis leptorrhynchoides]|uniref:uncharacterized protein n=1 Tax=Rutidosis leptorrhynchoides TaxID=125765 RepID=UPI003A99CC11
MSVAVGFESASEVWLALENAYRHDSTDRVYTLRDQLRSLQKGTSSVAEFVKKFKALCDQLSAIASPVDELDKFHWFLCGLGPSFETLSTLRRTIKSRASLRDLFAQAESHELFLSSMQPSVPSQAAFAASSDRASSNYARGRGRGRSNNSFG